VLADGGGRAGHRVGSGRAEHRVGSVDLERLLAERGDQLFRAAIALTGSRADGEDLLQAALERILRHPRVVESDLEGYLRRTLYNLAADGWRRRGNWQRKLPLVRAQYTEALAADALAGVDLRDAMVRILAQLPQRQRAVIVLRYWEQRTESETAALLGCSEGSVKSAASRALRRMRELAAPWLDEGETLACAAAPHIEERS
jgi:RNA polymerase sigma factor (sigma-70 family)